MPSKRRRGAAPGAPRETAVRVEASLSFLINKLAQFAGRGMAEALAPLSLQPRESGILAAVSQFGAQQQQRLGELLVIDRTTMVLAIDRLEELGYVERVPQPTDRRAFLITLTDKGEEAVWEAKMRLEAFEDELLAPLTKDQQRQFRRALAAVVAPSIQSLTGATKTGRATS